MPPAQDLPCVRSASEKDCAAIILKYLFGHESNIVQHLSEAPEMLKPIGGRLGGGNAMDFGLLEALAYI